MSYLIHHGILGQKWGVRRYQNPDGTLTAEGRARLSKEYRKAHKKLNDDLNRNSVSLYVETHNRAAQRMNSGLIDKYNKEFDEKHADRVNQKGYRYDKDSEYESGYESLFEDIFDEEADQVYIGFIKNHEEYSAVRALVQAYGEDSLDDISRKDYSDIEEAFKRAGFK